MACRAVCGVAALANSRAIGGTPRLAAHPGKTLVRPQKDLEQVLSQIDSDSDNGSRGLPLPTNE